MLADIFPENESDIDKIAQEIQKVMDYMDVLYGIDNPLFLEDMKDREYLLKTLLHHLLGHCRCFSTFRGRKMSHNTYSFNPIMNEFEY